MCLDDALNVLDSVYRAESRNLFASLVRALGDFDAAEDALQDAVRTAAVQWPKQGVPAHPAGWLYHVAKLRGIDALRRKKRLTALTEHEGESLDEPHEVKDELLRLIFTCCHPAISLDAQVAMTLREVCELTTEEIARAFLALPPTIAQRIVRAKAKIREASIPFEVPPREELAGRLDSVLKTIYLVFNEGYSSSSGDDFMRPELVSVAVHLARQLVDLMPEPEAMGLLALMLLTQARSRARSTADGDIVLLEDQDRTLWDLELIHQASDLVTASLRSGRYGPYTLQAAIASLHSEAASYADTDWSEIVGLYDLLLRMEPSPIVELNRAVAVAMRDGPAAGIALIDGLLARGVLVDYHLTYASRGELRRRQGDEAQARLDFEHALRLTRQAPEKRFIQRRLSEISQEKM